MYKYTPGPWYIKSYSGDSDMSIMADTPIYNNPRAIARVYGGGVLSSPNEENIANTHLIVNSPKLYEALRELLNQLEGIGIYIPGNDGGQWAGTEGLSFKQTETVIAKMKGEAYG